MAVVEASKDIIAQPGRAAALWSTDEDMVEWRDGAVHPRPGVNVEATPLSLKDLAGKAGHGRALLGKAS